MSPARYGFAFVVGSCALVASATNAPAKDLNVFFVGNSLTDANLRLEHNFRSFVQTQGQTLSGNLARDNFSNIVAGAPLFWHYYQSSILDTPTLYYKDRFGPALRNKPWDALVLQPFGYPLHHVETDTNPALLKNNPTWMPRPREEGDVFIASQFISLPVTEGISPDIRVYMYETWPLIPKVNGQLDLEGFDYKAAYDATYNASVSKWRHLRSRSFYSQLHDELNAIWLPNLPQGLSAVPAAEVLYELNERLRANPQAGANGIVYDDVEDLYGDEIHLRPGVGAYVAAMTMYATLYGDDLSHLDDIGDYNDIASYDAMFQPQFQPITPNMEALIRQTVWDVVSTHPYTGVHVPEPATLSLLASATTLLLSRRRANATK